MEMHGKKQCKQNQGILFKLLPAKLGGMTSHPNPFSTLTMWEDHNMRMDPKDHAPAKRGSLLGLGRYTHDGFLLSRTKKIERGSLLVLGRFTDDGFLLTRTKKIKTQPYIRSTVYHSIHQISMVYWNHNGWKHDMKLSDIHHWSPRNTMCNYQ